VPPDLFPADEADARLPDEELLRRHVAGDPDAFATLVGRHRDRLWGVALRTMRNPEDAADALQDAYLAAFRRAASFRGDAQVTTWLHRVVVNACLDRLRAMRSRAADPLPEDLDRAGRFGEQADDPIETDQQRVDVTAAPVLVDMQGYSVAEAAAILRCAPGTVKSRCARGRARLAPLLADLQPTAAEPR
jgi:RNA polymerase sigma-70 factor (ECF subfamily)